MTKILVALDEKTSFAKDVATLAADCMPCLGKQLYIAYLVNKKQVYVDMLPAFDLNMPIKKGMLIKFPNIGERINGKFKPLLWICL